MATKKTAKKKKKAAAKKKPAWKFPTPEEIPEAVGVTFRRREHLVELYKQQTGKTAKNLAKAVADWVESEADRLGWGKVLWPKDYPKPTLKAGAVFVKGRITEPET